MTITNLHQVGHNSRLLQVLLISLLSIPAITTVFANTTNSNNNTVIRINAGATDYIDSNGNLWSADSGFNTGRASDVSRPIDATEDDTLFQSMRWDPPAGTELTYAFDVPNGDYQVKLHFAETYSGAFDVGRRVFDVLLENQLVADNLDVYAVAGANTALTKRFTVTVHDGQLNLAFAHKVQNPMVSAIEILAALPSSPKSPLRLSWAPASSQVAGYRIYFGSTPDAATQFFSDLHIASGEVKAEAPSVTYQAGTDLDIQEGDTACFRVTAYNNSGESKFSKPICETL